MPIIELPTDASKSSTARNLDVTTFGEEGILEKHLQKLLRENIAIIGSDPNIMVIAEEFSEWEDAERRIDLLGIDQNASLVVIELKRSEEGNHMELQALRYASMVSTMTFEHAVGVYGRYMEKIGETNKDPRSELLEFLGWEEPNEDAFAQDVRIVLASAGFGRELTTSVLWLRERGIDISCIRMRPYKSDKKVLVEIQRIIPLPEADEYLVHLSEKKRRERIARAGRARYDLTLGDQVQTKLSMRKAILMTFRYLVVEKKVAPEEFAKVCNISMEKALRSVKGKNVGKTNFISQARKAQEGKRFHSERFFCDKNELASFQEHTYALASNIWDTVLFLDSMTSLRENFREHGIDFRPTE